VDPKTPAIGVLASRAHSTSTPRLAALGAITSLVRKPSQLDALDGLVIPGGESTTFLKHLERAGFYDTLNAFVHTKPVFGTCAGCILLAKDVTNPPQPSFGVLDIAVERNAYGRQNDSAILTSETSLPGGPLEMVFIRAPRITRTGPDVETSPPATAPPPSSARAACSPPPSTPSSPTTPASTSSSSTSSAKQPNVAISL
jgi:5'-phosphate synthase pdxT subunit